MEGFFSMTEASGDLEQTLVGSGPEDYSKGEAAMMLSACTWRIREEDGFYSCEEWLGNGENLTYKFQFGKEFPFVSSTRGHYATGVVTKIGENAFLIVSKNKKVGAISEFKFTVDEFGIKGTWTIVDSKESSSFSYKRIGDPQGSWNLIIREGMNAVYDALELKDEAKRKMETMFKSHSLTQLGCNKWGFDGNGDVDIAPMSFGDEINYEMAGMKVTEVILHTRDGYISVLKIVGKSAVTTMKIGKNFQIGECTVDGFPDVKGTLVFVRE